MLRKLAYVFGIILIILGVLGFIKAAAPGGLVLGLFSADLMSSLIYIATGALALVAARQRESQTRLYFKVFGIVYALIAIVGLIDGGNVLGLMIVNGWSNVLNVVIAFIALWAGFGTQRGARGGM